MTRGLSASVSSLHSPKTFPSFLLICLMPTRGAPSPQNQAGTPRASLPDAWGRLQACRPVQSQSRTRPGSLSSCARVGCSSQRGQGGVPSGHLEKMPLRRGLCLSQHPARVTGTECAPGLGPPPGLASGAFRCCQGFPRAALLVWASVPAPAPRGGREHRRHDANSSSGSPSGWGRAASL